MEIVANSYLHNYNQYSASSFVRLVSILAEIIIWSCTLCCYLFGRVRYADFSYSSRNNKWLWKMTLYFLCDLFIQNIINIKLENVGINDRNILNLRKKFLLLLIIIISQSLYLTKYFAFIKIKNIKVSSNIHKLYSLDILFTIEIVYWSNEARILNELYTFLF